MTLIILLLVLVMERVALQSARWQVSHYLTGYCRWSVAKMEAQASSVWPVFVIAVLPAVAIGLFVSWLDSLLLEFVFSLLVIALCIGEPNVRRLYRQYLNAKSRGDEQAQAILHDQLANSCQGFTSADTAQDHDQQVQQAQALNQQTESIGETLIWINFRYYAAPIFYFVVLGLPGIVFYTCTMYLAQHSKAQGMFSQSQQQALFTWLEWLYWLPSRLVSLGFMIVGHFSNGLETWLHYAADFSKPAREMLCQVALKSEQYGEQPTKENAEHMVKLTKRNMVLFLVVVALLTLYGQLV